MRLRWRLTARIVAVVLVGLSLIGPPASASTTPSTEVAAVPETPTGFVSVYPAVAEAMRAAGQPYAGWADEGRTFLTFDSRGDGFAVEVLGDLATADRIAVLVPGVDSTLLNFDRGLDGTARPGTASQARALYDQVRADEPGTRVAVIAWLGYDAPDGIGWDAAHEECARAGARALVGLVRMVAQHRPSATMTVIGHSYGALVVGFAAPDLPAEVTDVVSVGGVGMGVDQASGLHTTARVWAAEAPDDWIHRVPPLRVLGVGHGIRPADAEFGALPLPVDGVSGHDGYLVAGTATLRALSRVTLGQGGDLAEGLR